MKNMWIIAKKDLGSFFSSPVFYSLTSVFLILNGFLVQAFEKFRGKNVVLKEQGGRKHYSHIPRHFNCFDESCGSTQPQI